MHFLRALAGRRRALVAAFILFMLLHAGVFSKLTRAQSTEDENYRRVIPVTVGEEIEFSFQEIEGLPANAPGRVVVGPIGLQKTEESLRFTGHHYLLGDNLVRMAFGQVGESAVQVDIIFRVAHPTLMLPCGEGEIASVSLSPDKGYLLVRHIHHSQTTLFSIDLRNRKLVESYSSKANYGAVAWEDGYALVEFEDERTDRARGVLVRLFDFNLKPIADINAGKTFPSRVYDNYCSLVGRSRLQHQLLFPSVIDLKEKRVLSGNEFCPPVSLTEHLSSLGRTYTTDGKFADWNGRVPDLLGSQEPLPSAGGLRTPNAGGLYNYSLRTEPPGKLYPLADGRFLNPGYAHGLGTSAGSRTPLNQKQRTRTWFTTTDYHWNPLEALRLEIPSVFHAQVNDSTIVSVGHLLAHKNNQIVVTFLTIPPKLDVYQSGLQLLPPDDVPLPITKNFTAEFSVANATGEVTYQLLYPLKGLKIHPKTGVMATDLAAIWKEHLSQLRQTANAKISYGTQVEAIARGIRCKYTTPPDGTLEMTLPVVVMATDSTGVFDVFAGKFIVHVPEGPILNLLK